MSKRTVLQLVQSALSHIGSDKVNSIADTQEALDVADIVRSVYFDMLSRADWPHLRLVCTLDSVSDLSTPTYLKLAQTVQNIDEATVFYDKRTALGDDPNYDEVIYCYPDEFQRLVLARSSSASDSNVVEVTDDVKLYVYNDVAPTYYTSFDDETLVFDSYNIALESTLQGAKSQFIGYKEPAFSLTDSFIPDLPSKNFPQFEAEVKAQASASIAQEIDRRAERSVQKHELRFNTAKWRTKHGIKRPDYGRTGRYSRR